MIILISSQLNDKISKSVKTGLQGYFSSQFNLSFHPADNDPTHPGTSFSRDVYTEDGLKRQNISEPEASKLVKLVNPVIRIDRTLDPKEFAETLAHELGHGTFAVNHGAVAFFRKGPDAAMGHDKGNPSGGAANKAEKEFRKNYKNALEIFKQYEKNFEEKFYQKPE